jgi:hypothetical protein
MAEKIGEFYYTVTADGKVAVNEMNGLEKKMTEIGERTSNRIGRAFSRMFGIGALIAGGMMAVRQLYQSIADGVGRAIANNERLKTAITNMKSGFQDLFTTIGIMLTPLIEMLVSAVNKLLSVTNKALGSDFVKTAREDFSMTSNPDALKKAYRNKTKIMTDSTIDAAVVVANEQLKEMIKLKAEAYKPTKESNQYYDTEINNLKIIISLLEKQKKTLTPEDFKKREQAVAEFGSKLKSLSADMLNLFGVETNGAASEFAGKINNVVAQFQALGKAMDALKDSSGKINFTDVVQSKDIWAIIVTAIAAVADAIYNADMQARNLALDLETQAISNTYKNYLEELRGSLEDLLDIMIEVDFQVDKEKIIRNNTTDDIDREVAATKELIKTKQEFVDQTKANAKRVGEQYGLGTNLTDYSQYEAAAAGYETQAQTADAKAQYWRDEIERWRFILPVYADSLWDDVWEQETLAATLRGQKDVLAAIGADMKTASGYELDLLNAANDLTDLDAERLGIMQKITDEMRAQTRELLSQQAKLGILDVENYGDIIKSLAMLKSTGLSGLDLLQAGSDVGFANQAMRSTNIGSIIYNAYSSSNNSANLNGVLNTQTGA